MTLQEALDSIRKFCNILPKKIKFNINQGTSILSLNIVGNSLVEFIFYVEVHAVLMGGFYLD